MTSPIQENQAQPPQVSDKELNFRRLEQKYQQELAQERAERARLTQELESRTKQSNQDDDDDDEPYVDKKKLNKTLERFGQQTQKQTQGDINNAVHAALKEERKANWLKQNSDFYEVLKHADKFAEHDPELAETILEMPEGFERQKLVYKNIKALGIDKPASKQPSIQEKVDANRRSPYYQPSGVGTAPYANVGDFSQQGQKSAYDKMKQLQSMLRL